MGNIHSPTYPGNAAPDDVKKTLLALFYTSYTFLLLTPFFRFYFCSIDQPSDTPSDEASDVPSDIPSAMFYDNCGGNCPKWLSTTNHCTWSGITYCDANYRITKIKLANRQLSGTISDDLATIANLVVLDLTINDFTGAIPTPVCDRSTSGALTLSGDATNCPNVLDATTGLYGAGCCDNVNFLDYFIEATYENESCKGLDGTDSNMCTFMQSRLNHDQVHNWNWLQELSILAQMYFNNCGSSCAG